MRSGCSNFPFPEEFYFFEEPAQRALEAHERLKRYGEEETMLDGPVVIKDNALRGTSAWANTFLGRDHLARNDGMNPERR